MPVTTSKKLDTFLPWIVEFPIITWVGNDSVMIAGHTVQQCVKDAALMEQSKVVYKSYLMRLWCSEENGRFHIRLQTIEEEPVILYFYDLDSFVAFWLQDHWSEPKETHSSDA